ncbi:MAG: tetratricopeptide repeat protein [Crocinitomicaceae bacterium]|nr:tetratricopeptide repeat protein [Crocinitomicaceae bacterium]
MTNFLVRFIFTSTLILSSNLGNNVWSQNLDSLKREWQLAGNDVQKKLTISGQISDIYFNVQLDSLEKYSNIQIQLAEKLKDSENLILGYSALGSIYFRKGKISDALYYYNKAKEIAEKTNNSERLFAISVNLASLNIVQGKNFEALRNYFIARSNLYKIRELKTKQNSLKLKSYEGQLNLNIGIAYFNMNDYKNASRFYSEAMTIAMQLKDTSTIAKAYTNLAEIELLEQNYNVAEDFLYRGKRLKEAIKDSISLKVNYLLIGQLYLELGRFDKALENFKVVEALLKNYPDISIEKVYYINLGTYYLRQNRVNKAIVLLNKSKQLNVEEYSLKNEIEINQLLSEANFLVKNYEKANLYREIYEGIRDSIYNSETSLEIARLEMFYNAQYDRLRDSLNVEEQNNQKIREIRFQEVKNFYLILWLVFLAIAFGAIVYVLGIVRKRNKELKKSIKEKEALMKEVHHRVKNNFQIISSLMNIQANKLKSDKLLSPMQNMQNRILAMSLVHEKLYISDFSEAVQVNEYFKDLAESIKKSLLSKKSAIDVNIEGDDFLISLEKAIPLGLIVNELITNSIKYGAKEGVEVSVQMHIRKEKNQVFLTLKDNGKGFPEDFDPESYTESIGLELVNVLIEQLDGTIEFKNNNGAQIDIKFSL